MNTSLPFDHLVLMLRDRLVEQAPAFEADGYTLTELSVHNLGSMNRLITLDSAYIELLGWPAGQPPARKEIADSPMGPEALVFRTPDAHATHRRLQELGFKVNPVVSLQRPIKPDGNLDIVECCTDLLKRRCAVGGRSVTRGRNCKAALDDFQEAHQATIKRRFLTILHAGGARKNAPTGGFRGDKRGRRQCHDLNPLVGTDRHVGGRGRRRRDSRPAH